MGTNLFDQYTYLHFATGIIAYFWGITFWQWFFLHLFFEITENTDLGMKFINKYLFFWPGGKPQVDTLLNICGDQTGALIGWLSAYLLDHIGNKYKWYSLHIQK